MADKQQIENSINYRFKDLGDGTYARVMALDGGVTISSVTVSDVEISNDVGNPIPTEVLGLPGASRTISVSTTSTSTSITSGVKRISIKARGCDMRYSLTDAPTATVGHFIESGERLDLRVPASATIQVIRDSSATENGNLEITELV
jgi:hypothetical protein